MPSLSVIGDIGIIMWFVSFQPAVIAGVVAVVILGIAILAANESLKIGKNAVAGLAVVVAVAVLGGGIWAAVDGEREFHEHEVHGVTDESQSDETEVHDEDGESHAEDGDENDAEHTDGDNDGE